MIDLVVSVAALIAIAALLIGVYGRHAWLPGLGSVVLRIFLAIGSLICMYKVSFSVSNIQYLVAALAQEPNARLRDSAHYILELSRLSTSMNLSVVASIMTAALAADLRRRAARNRTLSGNAGGG
jgi:hypothetical protein